MFYHLQRFLKHTRSRDMASDKKADSSVAEVRVPILNPIFPITNSSKGWCASPLFLYFYFLPYFSKGSICCILLCNWWIHSKMFLLKCFLNKFVTFQSSFFYFIFSILFLFFFSLVFSSSSLGIYMLHLRIICISVDMFCLTYIWTSFQISTLHAFCK